MRKKVVFLFVLSAVLVLQGCSFPEVYPIEGIQNILIAGLDVDESGDIILTTYVDKISSSAKPGEEQITYKLYIAKGKTVYDAGHDLHKLNEKHLSWAHTKYILVGEEAAKQGIDRLFSYFTEDDETKLLYRTAIVKGMTAQEFLQKASESKSSIADYLDTLFVEVKKTGESREIHLINYAINRNIPWNDVFIPAIELYAHPFALIQDGGKQQQSGNSGSSEENVINLNGFALFNKDKLAGFIENDLSVAFNILNNDLKGTQITVLSKNDHNVSLEILKCYASFSTSYNPLFLEIKVSLDSNYVEFHDFDKPLDTETIKYLEQQQNNLLKSSIEQCIRTMQYLGSDAAALGDKFYHENPYKWRRIQNDWKSMFPEMQFSVMVDSSIKSTYELKEPVSG